MSISCKIHSDDFFEYKMYHTHTSLPNNTNTLSPPRTSYRTTADVFTEPRPHSASVPRSSARIGQRHNGDGGGGGVQ